MEGSYSFHLNPVPGRQLPGGVGRTVARPPAQTGNPVDGAGSPPLSGYQLSPPLPEEANLCLSVILSNGVGFCIFLLPLLRVLSPQVSTPLTSSFHSGFCSNAKLLGGGKWYLPTPSKIVVPSPLHHPPALTLLYVLGKLINT